MKSASLIFDRRLYELLWMSGRTRFTTRDLCDAYAAGQDGLEFSLVDVRRYVTKQIRRMLRLGLAVANEGRGVRGLVYHLQPVPNSLQLELIDNGFETSLPAAELAEHKSASEEPKPLALKSSADTDQQLEALYKEIRLDFLASMGEAERFKLLMDEMPHLRGKVEDEYMEARDRSSRLLGHLRAIEKTLTTLASPR